MELSGHIENGVVVLDGNPSLPEGTAVTVTLPAAGSAGAPPLPQSRIVSEPGKLPYVIGGEPGTIYLTNEQINEILDDEEIEALKSTWNVPS